ncbi:MAG: hypothetical protein GF418_09400 [Chitinivibrionales bacterium]|nr:hypothetical protein [Chitinivibrionales bacterium]MBD3395824.1 hypothetical protein [Chitinivibrionales bacterium]
MDNTTRFAAMRAMLAVFVFGCIAIHAEGLKENIEAYFEELGESVAEIPKTPAAKKTRLSTTDRFFVRSLKKHQTIYSLIRTNSKGVIISEVVRGESPEREYRNVANQRWFRYVARNNKEYHGFLKEEGRYYLFWAYPVILTARSGKKRFIGSVAAKVDLWDCFHKFSAQVEQPFLVRLNAKSLYSHKWQKEYQFREEPLNIPGVDRITVRFEDAPAAAHEPDSEAMALAAQAEAAALKAEQDKQKPAFKMESYTPVIVIGVVLLLVLVVALIRLIMWLRYKRLISKIDKESIL